MPDTLVFSSPPRARRRILPFVGALAACTLIFTGSTDGTGHGAPPTSRDYYCETGSGGTDIHTWAQVYTVADDDSLVFRGGTDGYHSYRIPVIVRTPTGALIAFCEGRKHDEHDWGDIDVVYRRSTDNGSTWDDLQLLFSKHGNTCGNPTSVVDWDTGAIWTFMSYNDSTHNQFGDDGLEQIDEWGERRVYSNVSYDDGLTWNNLVNRTAQLLPPDHCWDAIGPGIGIQIKHGPNTGRLIVPAIGRNIYSDDHGETWTYSLINPGTSEGTIVELCNGYLMRNDRGACENTCPPNWGSCEWRDRKRRQISISTDEGETWSAWESDDLLLDKPLQGSIFRYNESYPPRLLFVNPASTVCRCKMRVRISYDDGLTWPIQRCIDPEGCGPESSRAGYSSITKTADFKVGVLHEVGREPEDGHSIIFRKFNLPWILNGTPEPVPDITEVSETEDIPTEYRLFSIYPNPSNPAMTLRFDLPADSHVRVQIFDVQGRRISTLTDEHWPAGSHRIAWRGRDDGGRRAPSGSYIVRFNAGGRVFTQKVTLRR